MSQIQIDEEKQKELKNESVKIDYKRVLYRALRFWYVVILSLVTGLSYAYLKKSVRRSDLSNKGVCYYSRERRK